MPRKTARPGQQDPSPLRPGRIARAAGRTLSSYPIAALPILDRLFDRLRLEPILRDHLPREDRRSRIPTATGLLLLLKNLLDLPRAPLRPRRVGRTPCPRAPRPGPDQLPSLNDDRVGRCLDRLFDADVPSLTLAVVVHAVREFDVDLDELHNDSTTITLHGDYEAADQERTLRGRLRLAVTRGHNKDHRPDLKQLLYILTVARDGAVPVQFRVQSGNATDDRSHRDTWDFLCKLTGRRDFLYVADCKLATDREHGLHPSPRRAVPQRPAPHPRRGRRLPREVLRGPGPLAERSTTSTTTRGSWWIASRSTSRRRPASRGIG